MEKLNKKVCNKCGIEKENTSECFGFTASGNLRNECKICQHERIKKHSKKEFVCECCSEQFQASKYRKTNLCNSCSHPRKSEEEKLKTKREQGRRYYNRKRVTEKNCASCGQTFKPDNMQQKYCSEECNPWIKTGEDLEKYKASLNKECLTCGQSFTGTSITNMYCSHKCKNKAENRRRSWRKDERWGLILSNGNVDKDITLDKLINRDNNICHICDCKCDNNDYALTNEGHFIAGNYYPSIDHVVAIVNGGTHTWDNVLLAHRICNSIKSDKLIV